MSMFDMSVIIIMVFGLILGVIVNGILRDRLKIISDSTAVFFTMLIMILAAISVLFIGAVMYNNGIIH